MKRIIAISVFTLGMLLFCIGLFTTLPGTHLTTYEILSGDTDDSGEKYSSIVEYVGGDAYNYIIGASLVSGKIAGTMAKKAIFITVGLLISCIGALSFAGTLSTKESDDIPLASEELPLPSHKI